MDPEFFATLMNGTFASIRSLRPLANAYRRRGGLLYAVNPNVQRCAAASLQRMTSLMTGPCPAGCRWRHA